MLGLTGSLFGRRVVDHISSTEVRDTVRHGLEVAEIIDILQKVSTTLTFIIYFSLKCMLYLGLLPNTNHSSSVPFTNNYAEWNPDDMLLLMHLLYMYVFIQERDMSALYLSRLGSQSKSFLVSTYPATDRVIEKLTKWGVSARNSNDQFQTRDKFQVGSPAKWICYILVNACRLCGCSQLRPILFSHQKHFLDYSFFFWYECLI